MLNFKAILSIFAASLTIFSVSKSEAFSVSLLESKAYVKCNTWNAVVSPDSLFIPEINIEEKGFEDKKYKLSVKWQKRQTTITTTEYGPYKDDRGKKRNGLHYAYKTVNILKPVEIKKDGQNVLETYEYEPILDELIVKLIGKNEASDNQYQIVNFGAEEILIDSKKTIPHYDAYGNVLYTNDYIKKVEVYPIYSRRTGNLIGSETTFISGNYYPVIDEQTDHDSLHSKQTYLYMKNSSGTWKKCKAISPYEDKGWTDDWETVEEPLASKLDGLKAALGI